MSKPIIGILSGSTRAASMNRKLVSAMAQVFESAGAQAQIVDLSDYDMPIYNGDLEEAEGVPKAAKRLIADLSACDGVFIATPEYNGCMPALLKNSIDWTTRVELGQFTGPVYGIGSATPGPLSGIMALRQLHFILNRLGAQVVPTQLGVGRYGQAFDTDGRLADAGTLARAEKLAGQMFNAIRHKNNVL
jgi:chromate reductase, NAD(P)H dehydrogenase (quinone)